MSEPELAAVVQTVDLEVSCKPPSEDSVSETQCVPVRLPLVSLSARPVPGAAWGATASGSLFGRNALPTRP